jgi:iron complex outermembrane receptor protein
MKLAASASVAVLSFLLAAQAGAQVAADPSATPQQVTPNGVVASNPVTAGSTAAAPAAQTTGAADAGQVPNEGVGLGDIVVTAERRETNLQTTPISISVLNSQALVDRHIGSLFNLADGSVPSLRVATFEARQSALTIGIRGIVPYDQNQTARDNGVGVYIDGIALGKTQGLNAALFDIERIEVLKGPQGTLFGRNTEGGALSLVTKAPTGEFDGRIVGGVGNFGSRNTEVHLDLPSIMGFALKFDGVYQHQDPTVKDPLVGSTGWNYYTRKGGRVAARWQPVDGLTADFAYDYAKDDNTPMFSQLLNFNPNGYNVGSYAATSATNLTPVLYYNGTRCNVAVPATGGVNNPCIAPKAPIVGVHPGRQYVADVGVPQQPSTDITHGFSANIKYKLAPWIELRSITAWRGVSTDQFDNSGGPERVVYSPSFTGEDITASNSGKFSRYSLSFLRQHQFSQEFQAVGSIPQLDYVVGAYYYTEHATEYAATPNTNLWNGDGTGYAILSPIPPSTTLTGAPVGIKSTNQGWQDGYRFVTRNSFAYDHNYSVFGQATFTPDGFDAVHLTAGGRWTRDKRRGTLFTVNNLATNFGFSTNISRFDPMLNVALDATQDVHLYAKYATGFRAGGADDRSQRFDAFGPESVKSYEIGAKMDFLDHRARLNLAGYIMNRKNTQFDFDQYDTDPASPTYQSHLEEAINAGDSHIRGVEADLTVKPTRELTLSGSYAYTYWDAPKAVNPLTGGLPQQLYIVYTPRNAASGAIDYVVPVGIGGGGASLRLHLDGNYASSQYSFELEPTKTDASFIANGRLALADIAVTDRNRVTVSVWTRNLFDRAYVYRRSAANSSPVYNYNGATLASTSYGGILGTYGNLNTPRTWGLELAAKF